MKEWLVKTLAMGVFVLFIIISVTPSIGFSSYLDDTTPPVTTISFYPSEPDGENGWYVSVVTVTLNATDDDSGVNVTKYCVDGGIWYNYTEPFILDEDGKDIFIEFYSIDKAGNQEEIKSALIDIDRTKPDIYFSFDLERYNRWEFIYNFWVDAEDFISGMNRVEFYIDDVHQKTVFGPGPEYDWIWKPRIYSKVIGFILKPEITEDYVKFYTLFVIAKLGPGFPVFYAYSGIH